VSHCCSELLCVAVSYSVLHALQRIAACCSMFQHVAVCVAACCSKLQCVAVCCSVLQRVAACCSVLQRVAACCLSFSLATTMGWLWLVGSIKL